MLKMTGSQREKSARIAGRQAQIMATHISMRDHMAGMALSPEMESDLEETEGKGFDCTSFGRRKLTSLVGTGGKGNKILETNDACDTGLVARVYK